MCRWAHERWAAMTPEERAEEKRRGRITLMGVVRRPVG